MRILITILILAALIILIAAPWKRASAATASGPIWQPDVNINLF